VADHEVGFGRGKEILRVGGVENFAINERGVLKSVRLGELAKAKFSFLFRARVFATQTWKF
jgi:hypothetical protein